MTFDPPCLFIYVISQGGPEENNNNVLALTHEKMSIYFALGITSIRFIHALIRTEIVLNGKIFL